MIIVYANGPMAGRTDQTADGYTCTEGDEILWAQPPGSTMLYRYPIGTDVGDWTQHLYTITTVVGEAAIATTPDP